MAYQTTRLSDSVVPSVFQGYMSKDTVQMMAFYQTGIMRADAMLASQLAGGGRTFNVPFWKDLDDTESDAASDDPDSHAEPGKLGSGTDIARRQFRTRGWSTANLTAELAGSDPMKQISGRVGAYWARQFDDIAINTLRGVFADNVANFGGDMVKDISSDSASAITSAELVSATAVMDAAQTMGDAKAALKVIMMHSVVNARLAKNDLITFRPDSEGKVFTPHYLDYRVMISDRMTTIVGVNRVRYYTYILGENAFGWAESPPAKPIAVEEDESAGDGAGVETLWTRRQFAIHPYGVKWTDASVAAEFPSNAELRLAANWSRVYAERKQLPMALLISNG